jgi:hypothetical protein
VLHCDPRHNPQRLQQPVALAAINATTVSFRIDFIFRSSRMQMTMRTAYILRASGNSTPRRAMCKRNERFSEKNVRCLSASSLFWCYILRSPRERSCRAFAEAQPENMEHSIRSL